ncbi:lysozyme [Thermodesulfovibrio yellowstonii]|uniref:lysozyme n=1 Tax=Thermodesulfovibrio yellowstonii TaxID=28262 RepID=UPI0024B32B61|nr:lysozyme [Thermodesulfovibrio yellowstonii]MDI6865775.1 lysozyme [Thermodesulfovibrio yellowstonii]
MTERGIELVRRFEGFSPRIYLCPAGYPTVGYGHVVTPEERYKFVRGITKEEAEELLRQDLAKFEVGVRAQLKGVRLHDYCIDALTSFAYNVGLFAFKSSTLRRLILQGELTDAAEQFLRWVYAGGRKLRGLELRRRAERELFLEGVDGRGV